MSDLNIILSYILLPLSIIYLTDKLIEYLINKKVRTYPIKKILIPLIITISIFIGIILLSIPNGDFSRMKDNDITQYLLQILNYFILSIFIYAILNTIYLIYMLIFKKSGKTKIFSKTILLFVLVFVIVIAINMIFIEPRYY